MTERGTFGTCTPDICTYLAFETGIAADAAIFRICRKIGACSPAEGFFAVVGIISFQPCITVDSGRRACALDTRACRITGDVAVSAVYVRGIFVNACGVTNDVRVIFADKRTCAFQTRFFADTRIAA